MTENLILCELQTIHEETLTKTKEEHTLYFRMINPTEKFNFNQPILNTTKLALIRLSVYNSVFIVNRRNNQFLYASSTVIEGEAIQELASPIHEVASPIRKPASPIAEALSSNNNSKIDSNITSVLNKNYKGIPLLYSTITPGAYELADIAELIKEETDGNVIIEPYKIKMEFLMEIKQGVISCDVEN